MKTNYWLFLVFTLTLNVKPTLAQEADSIKWHQYVKYEIDAELDTTQRRISGSMNIIYKNNSPDKLTRIYFQVPANAYHDEGNTAVREMSRFTGGNVEFDETKYFPVKIESVQFLSIGEETKFPLQAYDFSDTILDLTLPFPLQPGDVLKLGMSFFQDLKQKNEEEISSNFMMWFPRLAVYDESGWHAEPFHFMMEPGDVYSEFADFDVKLSVPGNFIVTASGELISGDPGWQDVEVDTSLSEEQYESWADSTHRVLEQQAEKGGARKIVFQAKNLHDFVWSASPEYVTYRYNHEFPVHIFLKSDVFPDWDETISNLDQALNHLKSHFGDYPFSHLSIVRNWRRNLALPYLAFVDDFDAFELAFGLTNIYVPGLVSVDGYSNAWLVKGLQMYMGKSIQEKMYGKRGYDHDEAQEDMSWLERQYPLPSMDGIFRTLTQLYSESGQNEPISKKINEYYDPLGFGANVYLKAEIFYEMLKYVVGDSSFQASLLSLVSRHAFTHINEKDLQAVFEETSGEELDWFFNQWLKATPTVDYKKGKISKKKKGDKWVTEVEVERQGDGIMPIDIEIELADGSKAVQRWDGKAESATVIFETEEKPGNVAVDPEDRIMDSNRLNNTARRLELRPDLPLLKFIHMPNDAFLVLWRPKVGYNKFDGMRIGARARTSFRAFYHNLNLSFMYGLNSNELDGLLSYSHPIKNNLMNRTNFLVRKNEGRFEADAHFSFNFSKGVMAQNNHRNIKVGFNYSDLLNDNYTFRKFKNDVATLRLDEWDDVKILLGFVEGETRLGGKIWSTGLNLRFESALPGGDKQFSKLAGKMESHIKWIGLNFTARGNLATSFGADELPLQDQFRAEGASARERFSNDILKTGDDIFAFSRRFVEGGGYLRGYAGQPLPAEKYATVNFEITPTRATVAALRPFLFYDAGRIWPIGGDDNFVRTGAGFGITFLANELQLFGGNLKLFENLSAKVYFPIWLSHPLPGEDKRQFRWYFTLGKSL